LFLLERLAEACASYEKALALARQEPERRFLAGRLAELKIKIGSAVDFPSA
jgi:RNA polymerase sigma-70 factor (ECF subfamily)